MRRVSMATRDELLGVVSERYRASGRSEKSRIVDEFAAATGYHRKHAMRVLRIGPSSKRSAPRPSRRIYGAAEREVSVFKCFVRVLRFSRREALARFLFEIRRLFAGAAIG